jgi:A/G-specific adenine glycosylase
MLQQTTVPAVIPYFGKFVDKWPTVQDLAAAADDDVMQAWAGLGYYARARNLLKCARVVTEQHGGHFPQSYEALIALPGIGDYTAAAILAIAFNVPATVIDGNVDRVVARYFAVSEPLPDSKPLIRRHATFLFEEQDGCGRPGDFAQAMMDLGATICTPRSPDCRLCPVASGCEGFKGGMAASLPAKRPKKIPPRRAGYVYWIINCKGDVLLEKRPVKGLLGGMTGLPTTEWVDWPDVADKWPEISHISAIKTCKTLGMGDAVVVRHVFTHFRLELRGVFLHAPVSGFSLPEGLFWAPLSSIAKIGFPTVFKKFVRLVNLDDPGFKR